MKYEYELPGGVRARFHAVTPSVRGAREHNHAHVVFDNDLGNFCVEMSSGGGGLGKKNPSLAERRLEDVRESFKKVLDTNNVLPDITRQSHKPPRLNHLAGIKI